MVNLNLEFVGFKEADGAISVNGEVVKLKKNKDKTYSYNTETEKEKSEIVIYKTHQYNGKHWFWWNFLYFIVSVFGIFDMRQNKKCLVLDAKFIVSTEKDTNVKITRQNFEDKEKLINIETDAEVEEVTNVQYYDKEARKKQLKMRKVKIATAAISLALIVLLIVLL